MSDIHKICPECDGEYQPRVETCPDCGASLRWSTDAHLGSIADRRFGPPRLEPSPELVLLRYGELRWVRSLAERLDREGVRSFTSIVADPAVTPEQLGAVNFHHDGTYYLFVLPEDLERGEEVDHALLLDQIGDLAPADGFPADESGGCPACGARLSEGAEECPSCELSFRWPEEGDLQEG